eukprot:3760019-Amphidinium_carterae.1
MAVAFAYSQKGKAKFEALAYQYRKSATHLTSEFGQHISVQAEHICGLSNDLPGHLHIEVDGCCLRLQVTHSVQTPTSNLSHCSSCHRSSTSCCGKCDTGVVL